MRYIFIFVVTLIGLRTWAFCPENVDFVTKLPHKPQIVSEKLAYQAALEIFPELTKEEATKSLELSEAFAITAIEKALPKSREHSRTEIKKWIETLEQSLQIRESTVIEHTALQYMLKFQIFETDATTMERATHLLRRSWKDLVGAEPPDRNLLDRLPKRVQAGAPRDQVLFHQALFHSGVQKFRDSVFTLYKDYLPKSSDAIFILGLGASLFSKTGADTVSGFLQGYAVGTFVEYSLHRYLGHASTKTLKTLEKFGRFGQAVKKIWFSHTVVHHGSYGTNYVEPFAPKATENNPDFAKQVETKKQRIERAIESMGADFKARMANSKYGTVLYRPLNSILSVAPFSLAISLLTGAAANHVGLDPGYSYYAASAGAATLFVPASHWLHPYLHMKKNEALATANPFMRWLLQTRFVAWTARSHFAHHDGGGHQNQNLVAGADFVFGHQPLTIEQLIELRSFQTFY